MPHGMRVAALELASELPFGGDPLPDNVTCELDRHDYGEHTAQLRDLGKGSAVWITWGKSGDVAHDIKVQILAICDSASPSEENYCWLPEEHWGGHSWERYE
ncbi:hypothetical protein AB5J72_26565 [Streptomyces sp. CG1]|uniref:hypothetical protein n=1 Tax=Streptomyces sp. CG1 TaxID=1287523 RepID=UPI0034E1F310